MKRAFLIVFAMLVTFAASPQSVSQLETEKSYISLTGKSSIEVKPDLFILNIVIDESDSKGRYTVQGQQDKMVYGLKKIGVDTDKNLKLANLLSQHYKRKEAYSSVNYSLELSSEQQLFDTYKVLDELYISNVVLVEAKSSKMQEYRKEARIAAVKNAKEVAADIASALDQKLGSCFYVNDLSNDYSSVNYLGYTMMRAKQSDAIPENSAAPQFKNTKIEYRVQTKFFLLK